MRVLGRIVVVAVCCGIGFLPGPGAGLRFSQRWPIQSQASADETAQDKKGDNTDDGVGELTGRFTVRGKLAPPRIGGPVMPRTGKRITDDSIKVSGKDQGLANVFVYMRVRSAEVAHRLPADRPGTSPMALLIYDGHIVPRAFCLRETQPVFVFNLDKETSFLVFNQGKTSHRVDVVPNSPVRIDLKRDGPSPGRIEENAHDWLRAEFYLADTPYAAVSDEEGRFTIKNVPVGTWEFNAWHSQASSIDKVFIDAKPVKWTRGSFSFTIYSGKNSIGAVEIPSESFRK
jgi:hypothetical protein